MDPEAEAKRRKSIAYILRRRKRGRKSGANSGDVVKSVNRRIRGHVVFKPSGGVSPWWQRLLFLFIPILIISPAFMIGPAGSAFDLEEANIHPFAWVIIGTLGVLSIGVMCFAAAYFSLSIWRAILRLVPHKKE